MLVHHLNLSSEIVNEQSTDENDTEHEETHTYYPYIEQAQQLAKRQLSKGSTKNTVNNNDEDNDDDDADEM